MRPSFAFAMLALALFACSDDDGDDASPSESGIDCDTGAVPTFAQVTAFQRVCTNCHDSSLDGAERNGAPEGYDFDAYDSAADEAEEIAEMVMEGLMPPASSGCTLTNAEETALYRWALCGTPE